MTTVTAFDLDAALDADVGKKPAKPKAFDLDAALDRDIPQAMKLTHGDFLSRPDSGPLEVPDIPNRAPDGKGNDGADEWRDDKYGIGIQRFPDGTTSWGFPDNGTTHLYRGPKGELFHTQFEGESIQGWPSRFKPPQAPDELPTPIAQQVNPLGLNLPPTPATPQQILDQGVLVQKPSAQEALREHNAAFRAREEQRQWDESAKANPFPTPKSIDQVADEQEKFPRAQQLFQGRIAKIRSEPTPPIRPGFDREFWKQEHEKEKAAAIKAEEEAFTGDPAKYLSENSLTARDANGRTRAVGYTPEDDILISSVYAAKKAGYGPAVDMIRSFAGGTAGVLSGINEAYEMARNPEATFRGVVGAGQNYDPADLPKQAASEQRSKALEGYSAGHAPETIFGDVAGVAPYIAIGSIPGGQAALGVSFFGNGAKAIREAGGSGMAQVVGGALYAAAALAPYHRALKVAAGGDKIIAKRAGDRFLQIVARNPTVPLKEAALSALTFVLMTMGTEGIVTLASGEKMTWDKAKEIAKNAAKTIPVGAIVGGLTSAVGMRNTPDTPNAPAERPAGYDPAARPGRVEDFPVAPLRQSKGTPGQEVAPRVEQDVQDKTLAEAMGDKPVEPAAPYASESSPPPIADGAKARRREVVKARVEKGETINRKFLEEFAGEEWADKALTSQEAPQAPQPPATGTIPPEPPVASTKAEPITFKTAKGSTYQVHEDGTTTRDKAARPEHPGEQGPQPRSGKTVYIDPKEAEKLSIVQAEGVRGQMRIVLVDGDRVGVGYHDGPDAGKLIRDTVIPYTTTPEVGKMPLELWESKSKGMREHFGNPITEISPARKSVSLPVAPEKATEQERIAEAARIEETKRAKTAGKAAQRVTASRIKPAWEQSPDELRETVRRSKQSDREITAEVFGDNADEYRRAERTANSTALDPKIADAAYEKVQEMEAALSEEQRNRLFGTGEQAADPQLAADMLRAIQSVDLSGPEAMGRSLRFAIIKLGNETDPANMTRAEQVAYATMRFAEQQAADNAWDTTVISESAIRAAGSRFADPQDAVAMLGRFLRPKTETVRRESLPSPKPAAKPKAEPVTFKTAKGSTYRVHEDGTTTRDKAARPEHPGEQGPQPRSGKTVYIDPKEADKLSIVQAEGGTGKKRIVLILGDLVGVGYHDGPHAGKIITDTVIPYTTTPEVGKMPLELWESKSKGMREHFGNPITEISPAQPPAREPIAPETATAAETIRTDTALAKPTPKPPSPGQPTEKPTPPERKSPADMTIPELRAEAKRMHIPPRGGAEVVRAKIEASRQGKNVFGGNPESDALIAKIEAEHGKGKKPQPTEPAANKPAPAKGKEAEGEPYQPTPVWQMTREEAVKEWESRERFTVFKGDLRPLEEIKKSPSWHDYNDAERERWVRMIVEGKTETAREFAANKPVPRAVLEDYKGQPWADDALAKMGEGKAVEEKRVAETRAPDGTSLTLLSVGESGRDGFKVIDEAGNVLVSKTKAEIQEQLKGEGLRSRKQIIPAIQKAMFGEALSKMGETAPSAPEVRQVRQEAKPPESVAGKPPGASKEEINAIAPPVEIKAKSIKEEQSEVNDVLRERNKQAPDAVVGAWVEGKGIPDLADRNVNSLGSNKVNKEFQDTWTKRVGGNIKRLLSSTPEFAIDPTLTVVDKQGGVHLRFRDGYQMDFKPAVFGLDPDQLKAGQRVRIDLAAFGIDAAKYVKAAESVAAKGLPKLKPDRWAPDKLASDAMQREREAAPINSEANKAERARIEAIPDAEFTAEMAKVYGGQADNQIHNQIERMNRDLAIYEAGGKDAAAAKARFDQRRSGAVDGMVKASENDRLWKREEAIKLEEPEQESPLPAPEQPAAKGKRKRRIVSDEALAKANEEFKDDPTEQEPYQRERGGFVSLPGGQKPEAGPPKPWLTTERTQSPDAGIEEFFGRTNTIHKPSTIIRRIAGAIRTYFAERFNLTPYAPKTPEAAYARDAVRTMPDQARWATHQAAADMLAVVDGDGTRKALDPAGLDLLRRKVFAEDLLSELSKAKEEADAGKSARPDMTDAEYNQLALRRVPKEFSGGSHEEALARLTAERDRLDDLIGKVPSVADAYAKRQELWKEVSEDLVERGVISEENAKNSSYVRHFVLEYMESQGGSGRKKKLEAPNRPYGRERKGTSKDISTDYLNVELKALSDIYRDNAIEDLAHDLAEHYAFKPSSQEAKSLPPAPAEPGMRVMALDRTNFGNIVSISASGESARVHFPNRLSGAEADVDLPMSSLRSTRGLPLIPKEKMTPEQVKAAAEAADQPPPGYVAWQFKRGNVMYRAKTVVEADWMKAVTEAHSDPAFAGALKIPESQLRDGLVLGGKRKTFFVPEWLADTLNNLPIQHKAGTVTSIIRPVTQFWKRWILRINPIRYNSRNALGDSERVNAAGQTSAFARIPEAVQLLVDPTRNQEAVDKAVEYGAISSSLWHEMGDASSIPEFERFRQITTADEWKKALRVPLVPFKIASRIGQGIQDATQFREDVLRMSVYLHALDNVNAFIEKGTPIRHWAGSRTDIEALAKTDKYRAAAKLSRETLGDYGNFTPWENNALRNGLIPFYSWLKINSTFWPHAMKEAAREGGAGAMAKTAGQLALRTARVAGNVALFAVRVGAAYAAANAWNYSDDKRRKKEESLPGWLRARPHIVLDNGIVSAPSALGDFTEWFGLDKQAANLARWERGEIDADRLMLEMMKTSAKAPVDKVFQGITPLLKAPVTAMGVRTFPSVFEARPFAQAFTDEAVARTVFDLLGSDTKKFYEAWKGKLTAREVFSNYFSGSTYMPEDALVRAIEAAAKEVKAKSKATFKEGFSRLIEARKPSSEEEYVAGMKSLADRARAAGLDVAELRKGAHESLRRKAKDAIEEAAKAKNQQEVDRQARLLKRYGADMDDYYKRLKDNKDGRLPAEAAAMARKAVNARR